MLRAFALVVLGLIFYPTAAHAQYMDPGATSLVVQLVIAGVVGFAAVLKLYWKRLVGLFHRGSAQQREDLE